ncbi:MAG: hypothetical protein L0206_20275 [Actinobacteria bacterium]|nr:hypothetical protein [Actinomycetota bacterium]
MAPIARARSAASASSARALDLAGEGELLAHEGQGALVLAEGVGGLGGERAPGLPIRTPGVDRLDALAQQETLRERPCPVTARQGEPAPPRGSQIHSTIPGRRRSSSSSGR